MPTRSGALIIFLLAVVAIGCIGGCHSRKSAPAGSVFPDEKSMSEVLRGSWILLKYQDSIDAGLTPRLLESMLETWHSFGYYPDQSNSEADPVHMVYLWHARNNMEEQLGLRFKFSDRSLSFLSKPDEAQGHGQGQIARARLLIDAPDTILRVYSDSFANDSADFVKYDNSRCQHVDAYSHLVNSRFIAGKYFRVDDQSRKRHIIFTKCGNIEGAENIATDLRCYNYYEVQMSFFDQYGDQMKIYNTQSDREDELQWSVKMDSLILKRSKGNVAEEIILVKVQ